MTQQNDSLSKPLSEEDLDYLIKAVNNRIKFLDTVAGANPKAWKENRRIGHAITEKLKALR